MSKLIEISALKESENFKYVNFSEIQTCELKQSEYHLKFTPGKVEVVRESEKLDNGAKSRFGFFVNCLKAIGQFNWDFECIVNLCDEVEDFNENAPRLAMSRRLSHNNILIPDAHFPNASSIAKNNSAIDTIFLSKKNKGVFAGTDTGLYNVADKNQRFQFCYNNRNSSLGNFSITNFLQIKKETLEGYDYKSVEKGFITPEEQLKYKYIFNISGNTTCWDRLLWILASNSLAISVRPKSNQTEQMSWYYQFFDTSNPLVTVDENNWEPFINYLNMNPGYANQLNEKQKTIGKELCTENCHLVYLVHILNAYNTAYNSK